METDRWIFSGRSIRIHRFPQGAETGSGSCPLGQGKFSIKGIRFLNNQKSPRLFADDVGPEGLIHAFDMDLKRESDGKIDVDGWFCHGTSWDCQSA